MNTIKKAFFASLFFSLSLLSVSSWADDSLSQPFVVQKIQITGAHLVSPEQIKALLPVHVGESFQHPNQAIEKLYDTGWFSNITLKHAPGGVLIVQVTERPVIAGISITGNSLLSTDQLTKALSKQHIEKKARYNEGTVGQIVKAIREAYYEQGKYNAKIVVDPVNVGKDRVNLNIKISEGQSAIVKSITILGNQAFSQNKLLKQMSLSTPTLFSFISGNDHYSSEKLAADVQKLEKFYKDNGYANVKILPQPPAFANSGQDVYLTIRVQEGALYTLGSINFAWWNDNKKQVAPTIPNDTLRHLIQIKPGDAYSAKTIADAEKTIGLALGDKGYLAAIEVASTLSSNTVALTFEINAGAPVTVHRINFFGNTETNDNVLRTAMQQKESALYSQSKVDDSTYKLNQLPFLKNISLDKKRVANNQVDLDYHVDEVPAASANFGVGYSQLGGILLMVGLTQQNFLGEGKTLGINFSTSAWQRVYQLNYFNPYFTRKGIGFGYSAYFQQNDFSDANAADYALDDYGFSSYFTIPVSLKNSVSLGGGFDHTRVKLGGTASTQLKNFQTMYGNVFQNLNLTAGWNYQGLDRVVLPTQGLYSSLNLTFSIPTNAQSFKYYLATYTARYYQPLFGNFIALVRGDADYGNGYGGSPGLPFYKNFFAGGIGSVRGYEDNTLGPLDSNNQPLGGNAEVDGSLGLIFPNGISENLRTIAFVDAGNVYNTNPSLSYAAPNPTGLRYSTGVEADWLSPFGELKFSLAKALNASGSDTTSPFQFTIGTQF